MKVLKVLRNIFLSLLGIILLFIVYIQFGYNVTYDIPFPEVEVSTDSTVLARGEYLVRGPAHCDGCHTNVERIEDLQAGVKLPLTGGRLFEMPFAKIYASNITPDDETGIGRRTDAELARTLKYSVDADGHSILPLMPYTNMNDDDIAAIISYLRSQEPRRNEVSKSTYNLMGKVVKRFFLKPTKEDPTIAKNVDPENTLAYGRYLSLSVANCVGCHTSFDMQTMTYDGPHFSGGLEMPEKIHVFSTPNLTPDTKTGHMANWTETQFVQRFRAGRVYEDSPMPWESYAKMSDKDLKAIYQLLMSLDPVENDVGIVAQLKQ
ncbi:MAG: cytochrome c [Bacteroidota bacterium]